MRAGIYLGPRRSRFRRAVALLCWVLVPATLAHVWLRAREWQELVALRDELTRANAFAVEAAAEWDEPTREILARLGAVSDLGVTSAAPPTDVLRLLEETLPERVVLVAISLEPLPPRASLMLEAVAERASDVTELQESVARSKRVAKTQLLEERRTPNGSLSVRLQVDLVEGHVP